MKTLTFYDIAYEVDERYNDYAVFKLPSSNVDFCGHLPDEDKDTQNFFVQFKNGGTYLYRDIPNETVIEASKAESIGKFIRAEISGKYPSVKLEHKILTEVSVQNGN
ncbi:KTSC domain-containing protein [Sphingobacterium yanglingense]|uniref:KTSC domain-containing protein n=1 Tax=Sphingobacterium yanglingense TaxID=1437280 RepID=A0A4R6WH72_9SPHI|nr:KTSC domain-containing protein [Sphingobacterium yanglingense]TDQ79540.1 KTSC domain-containing protein [Sphingobacterium yanglingense]